MTDWTFITEGPLPSALDIVWCRFPFDEDPSQPGPKQRPALVRQVLRKGNVFYIEVTYGTSNTARMSNRGLYIANHREMVTAGLPQATLFQLDRLKTLPWAEEWFCKREDGTGPIVGRLGVQSVEYLHTLLGRGG